MKVFLLLALLGGLTASVAYADAGTIGFIEDFSLAEDRSEVLEQLIPGTEEYYFYTCLQAQHTGDFPKAGALLEKWIARYGYTPQVREIQNRQALLTYSQNPEKSLAHIRESLNLRFHHRKVAEAREAGQVPAFDPEKISISALTEQALSRYKNLRGVEDAGLDVLPSERLTPEQRRDLLRRLQRPDIPGLADIVVADLNRKESRGFGEYPIHRQLLRSQLDACLKRMPALLNDAAFVSTYLTKLAPDDDTDMASDTAARKTFLLRVWDFVRRLSPVHNSLRTHILYHLLDLNRRQDEYDPELFMSYIRLPRDTVYINPAYLKRSEFRSARTGLDEDFSDTTGLPPVHSDEELVRDYLARFFADTDNYTVWAEFIREAWLKEVFATTRILSGTGDMEQWYAMLTPEAYRRLKERVDIDFALTRDEFFGVEDPVRLDLDIKNVRTLIVRVFEINAFNYYRSRRKEVDTAINLDGLSATWEKVVHYDEPPLRRVRRNFEFPEIDRPGVFVIEFIGSGKSSRALIRKGRLGFTERITVAGHEFMVFDEKGRKCPRPVLWTEGREFRADADGLITVPFTTRPGLRRIILKSGDRCSPGAFEHMGEAYRLSAGFHTEAESLIRGRKSQLILRPVLTVNDHPADLSLLTDVRLELLATDRDGVTTTRSVPDFRLEEADASVFEFQVPDGLRQIRFALKGRVKNLSLGREQELSDETTFSVNQADESEAVRDIFLSHTDGRYRLAVLGKNGESGPGVPIDLRFKHRCFRDTVEMTLKTDADGRILLNGLGGIEWLSAETAGFQRRWEPARDRYRYPAVRHELADQGFRVPWVGSAGKDGTPSYTLLERRGRTWVADRTRSVRLQEEFLEIMGLPAGDYDFFLKDSDAHIRIRVTKGTPVEDVLISDHRVLEVADGPPLHIVSADASGGDLKVQLANFSDRTRVHVLATRFMPPFSVFDDMGGIPLPEPRHGRIFPARSFYIAMRDIGDEYRYILERKYAEKFPGNMLARPELLLNPWRVRKTETARDQARAGEAPENMADAMAEWRESAPAGAEGLAALTSPSGFDFLRAGAVLLPNLKPDEAGLVTVGREKIGPNVQIHILATDAARAVCREISLPETDAETRDLRMAARLDPDTHFTEQKRVSVVRSGETFTLSDISTSEYEAYDSLGKVYQLLRTLSGDATLEKFHFILDWPEMSPAEKQEKYSEYACHELNFFLRHKDPVFFERTVLPYLRNKKDKTFMDHWLLGADLAHYRTDWAFGQLNIAEQILLLGRGGEAGPYVKHRFELIPPDPETDNRLFDTALRGRSFDVAEADGMPPGFSGQAGAAPDMEMLEDEMVAGAAPPAPSVAAAPAPMPEKALKMMKVRRKKDVAKREAVRRLYQKPDKTEEWAENNYYHLPIREQNADLITVNAFWNDYAVSDPEAPFFSPGFIYATRNFSEMMLALAVLDLPFTAGDHEASVREGALTLKASGPMIVFHKALLPATPAEEKVPVMAGQNFFRADDRYRYVGNERLDKFAEGEFLCRTAYGCQVVLSNPSSAPQKLRVLLQIPQGAVPLKSGFYSKSRPVRVRPYGTWASEYFFYFPEPGQFSVYPAQVSKNGARITGASAVNFEVVRAFSRMDTESWDYISQHGSAKEVLAYIRSHNPRRPDLEKIAFRMKDKKFFGDCIRLLRELRLYHHTLWSYGVYHNVPDVITEYLKHSPWAEQCGLYLDAPLLSVDPVARKTYEHLEYRPLINARAHRLGGKRKILNDRFYEQYQRFLRKLSYQPALTDDDLVVAACDMLLQDRVSEAEALFRRVSPDRIATRLQYDYFRVYFDFYRGETERARQVASEYADYPVPRWRKLFRNALSQLDEMAGKAGKVADTEDRDQVQGRLAATEASLDFTIADRRVTLTYRNLSSCRVNYYPMEVELLFSRNPFVKEQTGGFAFIRPGHTDEIRLPQDRTRFVFELPEQFQSSNLMVEILGDGIRKSQACYANALDVQVIEAYGQLQVAHRKTGAALPKTYVKVYARRTGGEVEFYKDGYTDLRGRFDYASVSTEGPEQVEKFAILVLNDQHGAVIREADPPRQ